VKRRLLRAFVIAAALGAVAAAAGALAENIDPNGTAQQYAWGENVGWINAEPAGQGGSGVQVSGGRLTGYMWGENIGWINMSCTNNGTCGGTGDYGVVNDGTGNLSGYAWGENIGWISFACTNTPVTCGSTGDYGVHIDPVTGEWSGTAWGENIGWIKFDHSQTGSRVVSDDGDAIAGGSDNCPFDANASQLNTDATYPLGDALGDACDADDDSDGCEDVQEVANGGLTREPDNPLDYKDFVDVDLNGAIGFSDLVPFVGQWNWSSSHVGFNPVLDFDRSGTIGFGDFVIMVQDWNRTCAP
jgi:hypothetical protein